MKHYVNDYWYDQLEFNITHEKQKSTIFFASLPKKTDLT